MNVMTYHFYHDGSMCFYDSEADKFTVLDFEKLLGRKHAKNTMPIFKNDFSFYEPVFDKMKELGISISDYDWCHHSQKISYDRFAPLRRHPSYPRHDLVKRVEIAERYHTIIRNHMLRRFKIRKESYSEHHMAHAACGYYQSPFDKAFIWSHDGSGDGISSAVFIKNENREIKKITSLQRPHTGHWNYAKMYQYLGGRIPLMEGTPLLDIAGKIMGLSAYGDVNGKFYKISKKAMDTGYAPFNDDEHLPSDDFQEQADFALGLQHGYEKCALRVIDEYRDKIAKCDNNLVITGGGALNILINGLIQDTYPEMNVYVPPNPGDDGLTIGAICAGLVTFSERDMSPENRVDFTYGGVRWTSAKEFKEYNGVETTKEEVADMLKQGNIIGFVQGNHELGKRALGNRSIICDASFPDMKDKINVIKNREHYRPFAPMCRKEDAPKYFDATNYNFLSHMNIAVRTREEYKEQLASITHVDGTARLQTVTRDQNELMYDLLTLNGGVFLNTSFNVAGKPILNTLEDAFYILEHTALDAVVVRHEGQLYLFK